MYKQQRVVAVVQARMGSNSLPSKVLMPLAERPVLWHVIQRLKEVEFLDEIVVATGRESVDDEIAEFICWLDDPLVRLFRGPADDALECIYLALREDPPQVALCVQGDMPLFSPEHLQKMVLHLVEEGLDGIDGHHPSTGLTLGLGSEVYRYRALVDAHLLAVRPEERSDVSLFIRRRPHAFRVAYLAPDPALCTDYRLTLKEQEDYDLLRQVYKAFYRAGEIVDSRRVLRWLDERPDLVEYNAHLPAPGP